MHPQASSFSEIIKFNPYHDRLGRFSSAGSAASFTYKPGASTAHSKAIERERAKAGEDTDTGKGFKGTLYHGSPNTDIKEFDMSRAGQNTSSGEKLLFFTDSKQMAEDFSYERLEGSSKYLQQRGKKGRVYEVDVQMKNPLDLRKLSDKDVDNILKLDAEGLLTRSDIKRYAESNHQLLKAGLNLTADSLKELGYDGLIANTGKAGHNSLEYAVVDSKQAKIIKSYGEVLELAKSFSELIEKFNPYHDRLGRFTTAGGASSFTIRTRSKLSQGAADSAISREKERHASIMPTEAQVKTLKGIESRTRNLKKEQFRVVDRDGNVVMTKQGDKDSVSYKVGEAREHFPGNITIHNHPTGGTFSSPDLSDIGYGATEIRAAAPEGTYILRNVNHGSKWANNQKSWYDMREDLDAAALDFKSGFSLKKEVKATFAEEQKKVNSLADKFVKAMNSGASQDVLNGYSKEYDVAEKALRTKVEAAVRKAYTDQYHNWYKQNAMNYGLEYEFIPVQTKARKSFYEDAEMGFNNIRKSDDVVLDEKMNRDIAELTDAIMDELTGDLGMKKPLKKSDIAKSFSDLMKFNPYHDSKGRFTSGGGGTATFMTVQTRDPSKQHMADKAIARAKEQATKPKEPKAMTEQEYLDSKGVGDSMSGYTTDKLRGNRELRTQQGRKRFEREVLSSNEEYQKRREQARQEYREKVKNGELRDKTKIEQLVDRANGHPDNPSTQAARRMAEKKGIDWRTGEPLKKSDVSKSFDELTEDVKKFNSYHDRLGRFTSAGGASSMTIRTSSKLWQNAADKAIAREKERTANAAAAANTGKEKEVSRPKYLGETEKAVKLKMTVEDYDLETSRSRDVWIPKTQLSDDGVPGQWITEQKAQEFYQSGRRSPGSYGAYYSDAEGKKFNSSYTAKEKEYAKQRAESFKQGQNSYNELVQRAKDMGIKGVRVGMKRKTLEQKIRDAQAGVSKSYDDDLFQIVKSDEDKRLVFGWALVSATSDGQQIIDHQGDIVDQDELEEGAYEYVLNFRDAGEEHIAGLRKKARMVESVVFTEEKLKAMGIPLGTVPYGWWIGFYVDDDTTWERIKDGTYKMFSIEGRAIREPVNEPIAKADNEYSGTVAKTFSELMKFNPYHDRLGRFTSGGGGNYSFFTFQTKDPSKQHMADKAVARMKESNNTNQSIGSVKAIRVTTPDGTVLTYRDRGNGNITDLDGVEPKNTNNLSIKQIQDRAKQMGWKVETFDDNQLGQHDSNRAANRKQTDDFLNSMSSKDRSNTYRAPRKGWKGH